MATSNSSQMIYDEKVLKRTAVPRSLALKKEVSKRLQQFGRNDDFVVLLFHFDERITKLNHRLLIPYDKLVSCFADSKKLIHVSRPIKRVKAVPDWNSSLCKVVCDIFDFVKVQLRNGGRYGYTYPFLVQRPHGFHGFFPSTWNRFYVIVFCLV